MILAIGPAGNASRRARDSQKIGRTGPRGNRRRLIFLLIFYGMGAVDKEGDVVVLYFFSRYARARSIAGSRPASKSSIVGTTGNSGTMPRSLG